MPLYQTLSRLPGRYAVLRFSPETSLDTLIDETVISLTRTSQEGTLIVSLPSPLTREAEKTSDGWKGYSVIGPIPHDVIGVMRNIAQSIAKAEAPIMVVSTFDTDLFFLSEEFTEKAERQLLQDGFSFL